ncbi:MAG: radical SAM protein [Deltaproteobacteria bacterium]|nr:radical SAM protein [Deltaproteobacteria bacterium]
MAKKNTGPYSRYAESEINTLHLINAVPKHRKGRIYVALVYPNTYSVGMSNLGFQTTYSLINQMDGVVCERAFLPENKEGSDVPKTIESNRSLSGFDIIAFSISFEVDYLNLIAVVEKAGLPLQSAARGDPHPLIIAGGVACFLNPEPVAPFVDCFLIGEAERLLPRFFNFYDPLSEKKTLLKNLAKKLPGAYIPYFYKHIYNNDGTLLSIKPDPGIPAKVKRVVTDDISNISTCTAVLTYQTTFKNSFLIEVSRGCAHGCRFCSAGFVYRPPRFRPYSLLQDNIEEGSNLTTKIGFVGAAVSDHPDIGRLCDLAARKKLKVSFSSLRADALTPELVAALKKSRVKTAVIAPDAGSKRMRNVINKNISEKQILDATEMIVAGGIPNLKLYFMIGLPTETDDDIEAIILLCKKIKERFLKSSRKRKKIGTITVSINPFVPKPFTPFQWASMNDSVTLKNKIKRIRQSLRQTPNIKVQAESPKNAFIQAILTRGDRRSADILIHALKNKMNWPKTLKESRMDTNLIALRERSPSELLPWDFIDHGIKKSFLAQEYKLAKAGEISPPCPMKSCKLCGICE